MVEMLESSHGRGDFEVDRNTSVVLCWSSAGIHRPDLLYEGPSTASSRVFAFSRLCFGVTDEGSFLHTSELESALHLVFHSLGVQIDHEYFSWYSD